VGASTGDKGREVDKDLTSRGSKRAEGETKGVGEGENPKTSGESSPRHTDGRDRTLNTTCKGEGWEPL
jgi:hypothetical protein